MWIVKSSPIISLQSFELSEWLETLDFKEGEETRSNVRVDEPAEWSIGSMAYTRLGYKVGIIYVWLAIF